MNKLVDISINLHLNKNSTQEEKGCVSNSFQCLIWNSEEQFVFILTLADASGLLGPS